MLKPSNQLSASRRGWNRRKSAAFLFFIALMALLTSDLVGGLMLKLRTLFAGRWLRGASGLKQLSTSRKCCIHLAAGSYIVVRTLSSISLTGTDWLVFLSQSCLSVETERNKVESKSRLICPWDLSVY